MVVLDAETLTITLTFVQCAALWAHDEALYLNVWHPCHLEIYQSRWVHLPGDVLLATHLDFRDAAGRSWLEVVEWSYPPHPQCTHPDTIARWDAALERHLFTWWSSLTHPRFDWIHHNNPALLR